MRIKLLNLELTEKLRPVWGCEEYDHLRVLARYQGKPLGWVSIANVGYESMVSAERQREAIVEQLHWDLIQVGVGKHGSFITNDETLYIPITIVVCTRDRSEQLAGCLDSLLELDYPTYEIIVVDNAPSNDKTFQVANRMPVRYVREDRPGLDWARNCGIAEACYDIIAFTDDDVRPDPTWLKGLASGFVDPEVMAVTGPVAPAELETDAQVCFELGYGGMTQNLRRQAIRKNELTKGELLWATSFGLGANMAFRRTIFDLIGLFDVALDCGTPSRSGGDAAFLHLLLTHGHTLVYEPSAIVWHVHRRTFSSLSRQLRDNGTGFGSYLLTCARLRTVSRISILRFAVVEWLGWWILRRLIRPGWFPRRLILSELAGALRSPIAYRASQKHARVVGAAAKPKNLSLNNCRFHTGIMPSKRHHINGERALGHRSEPNSETTLEREATHAL